MARIGSAKHSFALNLLFSFLAIVSMLEFLSIPVFAQSGALIQAVAPAEVVPTKTFSAAIAFGAAAISAGWAIAKAGSAGLAASAERLEVRTNALIISALGEAIAIYGIVVALLILTSE